MAKLPRPTIDPAPMGSPLDTILTPAQVAELLHTSEGALAQMRYRGNGPKYCKKPRILYRLSDIREWIEANTAISTRD